MKAGDVVYGAYVTNQRVCVDKARIERVSKVEATALFLEESGPSWNHRKMVQVNEVFATAADAVEALRADAEHTVRDFEQKLRNARERLILLDLAGISGAFNTKECTP